MLKIWVKGFRDDCIKNPGDYFDEYKNRDWFNREDVKQVIRDIDGCEAVGDENIMSPIYGSISTRDLSHGCKTTILMHINPLLNVYASRCGDNCVPSILKLAEKTDVVVTLHHIMDFPKDLKAEMLDTGKIVNSNIEFMEEYLRIRRRKGYYGKNRNNI